MEQLEEHLKKWFGYNSFRSSQKEIVTEVLSQHDVVASFFNASASSIEVVLFPTALSVPSMATIGILTLRMRPEKR
jgi:hypothetical protein